MGVIDLYPTAQQAFVDYARARPVVATDPGLGGAYDASVARIFSAQLALDEDRRKRDVVQQRLDAYQAATGEALANPYDGPPSLVGRLLGAPVGPGPDAPFFSRIDQNTVYDKAWSDIAARFDQLAKTRPELGLSFPSQADVEAEVLQQRRDIYARSTKILSGSSSSASWWGAFLGEMAGNMAHPVNIASLVLGAGAASGIIRTALVEAGIGAVSQATVELLEGGTIREVRPDYTLGDSAANVLGAAIGGAALGGGLKAVARVWQAIRATRARDVPDAVIDAGNIVQREAVTLPREGTPPEVAAAQRRVVERVAEDIAAERPLTIRQEDLEAAMPSPRRAEPLEEAVPVPVARTIAPAPEAAARLTEEAPPVVAAEQAAPPAAVATAQAFGEPALVARAAASEGAGREVAAGMADAAEPWAAMREATAAGRVPPGLDITDDVRAALDLIERARRENRPVAELADQGEMFGGLSETGKLLLRGMFRDAAMKKPASAETVAAMLRSYADGVVSGEPAGAPARPAPLREALEDVGREDMLPAAVQRTTPDAIAKLDASPDVDASVIREAEQMQLTGRHTVPVEIEDELGNLTVKEQSLDLMLAEADAEIAAAREIEACAMGAPMDDGPPASPSPPAAAAPPVAKAPRAPRARAEPAPPSAAVGEHAALVRQALGNEDAFAQALVKVRALPKADLMAVAKEVAGSRAKSGSDAIRKITNAHLMQVTNKARALATGGRTAA